MSIELRNWYQGPSIAFDLDGTITDDSFPEIGGINPDILQFAQLLSAHGWYIVVQTSRPHAYYPDVRDYLESERFPFDQIVTCGKPNVDVYVDDRGLLPPIEALEAFIAERLATSPYHQSAQRFESLWDKQARNVPENPKYHHVIDTRFRVIVPVSGGLDSSTAYKLALDTYPSNLVVPLYVDFGQPHGLKTFELEAFNAIFNFDCQILDIPSLRDSDQHIVYDRNKAILLALAEFAKKAGWWADIWFGNLGGETPINEGDKSSRFLLTLQQVMTLKGLDSRIVSPFQALDKPDLIRLWLKDGTDHHLFSMKTCFSDLYHRCSACQTCFRMYAALVESGIDADVYRLETLKPFARKYANAMKSGSWQDRYSYRRMRGMFVALGRILGDEWNDPNPSQF